MQQLHFTWNGTMQQAREYVASVKRVQEKKERRAKMAKWFEDTREEWKRREEFEKSYFGEII